MYSKTLSGVLTLMWVCGCLAAATQRMAPHVTSSTAAIQTFVLLKNTSDASQAYKLQPYTVDGQTRPVILGEVPAMGSVYVSAKELLEEGVSHFSMEADAALKLSLDYKFGSNKSGLITAVAEHGASSWSLKGSASNQREYLAVVNMGEHTTPVWLHQRNTEGKILASARITNELAAGAKVLYAIQPDQFQTGADYEFEVIGDQYLAVLGLSGDQAGKLTLNNTEMKREAESTRDEIGVWFITDGSLSDVFEMMGYNVATDRMWQGELLRRTALGTLSEIFGADFIGQDSIVRATGYSTAEYEAAYAALSEEEQTVISSYVDGFNRRIAELRAEPTMVPFEFLALGISVEDWTTTDVLAWATTLQHQFTPSYGLSFQISFLAELQFLIGRYGTFAGASMFLDTHWTNDTNALSMVPGDGSEKNKARKEAVLPILKAGVPDVADLALRMQAQEEANRAALKKIGAFIKGGSYAWVVSGDKTASGNPILYSGPQLEDPDAFQAPGIVQEGSIRGGGINVSGLIITGVPAVIVGRTPHHAWSLQVGHASDQELYLDNPEDIISQRLETIHVAGGEDVVLPVAETIHGQVINAEPLLALKVANRNYEFGFVKATLGLARAQSMDEFGDAVEELAVTMHICYADVDKNIAYWHSGREPIRPHGSWILPQGSVAARLEWDADERMPLVHDRNNAQGFYGGWNNKAHPNYEDPSGSFRYSALHIAHTITDYLSTHDNLTFDEVASLAPRITTTMSTTTFSGNNWSFFGEYFRPVVQNNPTEARLAALAMIDGWDGQAVTGTPADWPYNRDYKDAWALQDTWLNNVISMTFGDEYNAPRYGNNLFRSRARTLHQMLDPNAGVRKSYNWFRNRDGGVSGRDEIILAALDLALEQLGEQPWAVGARQLTQFNHAFFGDLTDLVPAIATPFSNRATYAQCVEYGENGPIQIGSHFVLGQSGEITIDAEGMPSINPAYFGMMPYFTSFTLRPFPLFD